MRTNNTHRLEIHRFPFVFLVGQHASSLPLLGQARTRKRGAAPLTRGILRAPAKWVEVFHVRTASIPDDDDDATGPNPTMAGWFSWVSGKRDNKSSARDAIIGLREQLHLIAKKEEHLQTKIDDELRKAKANVTTNKRGTYAHGLTRQPRSRHCGRKKCTRQSLIGWPAAA